jgi:hypothetical protein
MSNRLVILKKVTTLRLERDAALVEAQHFKRDALRAAQRLARAEAELSRRGPSRISNQNEPPFEVTLRLLALTCKPKSSKAQREIRASSVWQDGIVQAPYVSDFS